MDFDLDKIEESFEALTEKVESLQEQKDELDQRRQGIEDALEVLEGDAALITSLKANEGRLESEEEQLKAETADAKSSLKAIREQLEQMEQETDNSAETMNMLRQIGENTEEGDAIIADRRAWLEECYRRVEELAAKLGEDYEKIGKFVPAGEKSEQKMEAAEESDRKAGKSKTNLLNSSSDESPDDPGVPGNPPGGPGGPDARKASDPAAPNLLSLAQQYEAQQLQNDRGLQDAMDRVFGKNGKPRQRMQKVLDAANRKMASRYQLGWQISTLDSVLDYYTDHGFEHIKQVAANALDNMLAIREYTASLGMQLGGEAEVNLFIAALYHDTGMDGGLKNLEEYWRERRVYDEANRQKPFNEKLKAFGETIRSNHPLRSAIHVLEDAEALKTWGADSSETALLTFLHSKSNSGVRIPDEKKCGTEVNDLLERCQQANVSEDVSSFARKVVDSHGNEVLGPNKKPVWKVTDPDALVRREFEVAVQKLHQTARENGVKFDPSFLGVFDQDGCFRITNEQAYHRLQCETSALRLADAQRPALTVTTTQSGKGIVLIEPDWRSSTKSAGSVNQEVDAVRAKFVDLKTGKLLADTESSLSAKNAESWNKSKQYYLGESNVDGGTLKYNPLKGKLEVEYRVKDAAKAPHCTREILKERMEEFRMPVFAGKVNNVVVVERGSAQEIRSIIRASREEKEYAVRTTY